MTLRTETLWAQSKELTKRRSILTERSSATQDYLGAELDKWSGRASLDSASRTLAKTLAAAVFLSIERVIHVGTEGQVHTNPWTIVDEATRQVNTYAAEILRELNSLYEFHYQPGFNNPVRELVFDSFDKRGDEFIGAIQTVLKGASHLFSEDVQLELIDTLGEISAPGSRQPLAHLMISLLCSQSDSIVDSAVNALASDGLAAQDAIPYLIKLEERTDNGFLKSQVRETLDSLLGQSHANLERA